MSEKAGREGRSQPQVLQRALRFGGFSLELARNRTKLYQRHKLRRRGRKLPGGRGSCAEGTEGDSVALDRLRRSGTRLGANRGGASFKSDSH